MSKIFTVLKWVWYFVSGVAGLIRHRSTLNNTDEMKTAKERQQEQTAVDQTNDAISRKDGNAIRNSLSED